MKAKVTRGGGFRGALNYVLDEGPKATGDKHSEIVSGNLAGATAREMSREFEAVRRLRPDIAKPVWHCSLSLPPGDEKLSAEKWDSISRDFIQQMGFPTDTPYTAVRHQDTDKDHIHVVASRVSLSGEVWLGRWEARRAIEATQELEKRHGLTLTPGLGDARAEKKALSAAELNMAARTKKEPPRQKLQRLCDEALKDAPGALEFAERLQAAGVSVRPNIASTGKMNGYGFKIDGIKFTGQDLGAGYKWVGLQKRGVTYEQIRDGEGLERLRAAVDDSGRGEDAAADHSADERQNIAAPGNNIERDIRGPEAVDGDQYRVVETAVDDIDRNVEGVGTSAEFARDDFDRDGESLGASDFDQPGVTAFAADDIDGSSDSLGAVDNDKSRAAELTAGSGRGDSSSSGTVAADQPGVVEFGDDQSGYTEGVDGIRHDDISDEKDFGNSDSTAAREDQPAPGSDISERDGNRRDGANGQGHDKEYQYRNVGGENSSIGSEILGTIGNEIPVLANDSNVSDQRDSGRGADTDGLSRFRKISAARRRATENRNEERYTDKFSHQSDRQGKGSFQQDFKQINPTSYLENQGYTVKREGRHMSAQVNGDEIYRLTEKPDGRWIYCDHYGNQGGDNIDLVQEIEPGTKFTEAVYKLHGAPSVQPQLRPAAPPRVPPRMPTLGTIEMSKGDGRDYLKRRGISQETIAHAEKAGMLQYVDNGVLFVGRDRDGTAQNVTRRAIKESDEVQKRDFKGSDKSFPPILLGDPARVWIVEGGTDALALHDLARRKGQQPPTVIVSGGANVRSFLENSDIQAVLKRAEKVTICKENEKDEKAKARADAGHEKQADRVREITGVDPHEWTPPPQDKDLAELNARQQSDKEVMIRQMQELQQRNRDQEPDRDSPGMSRG